MAQQNSAIFPFSFLSVGENEKALLRQWSSSQGNKKETICTLAQAYQITPSWLHANRDAIAANLLQHTAQMQALNPAIFPFLSAQQKIAISDCLKMTLWTTFLQYCLDIIENRARHYGSYVERIEQTQCLLQQLERSEENTPKAQLCGTINDSTPYLGLAAATKMRRLILELQRLSKENKQYFADLLKSWREGKTKFIIDWMSELNALRLYWVWGNSLLDTIFSLAHQFGKIDTAYFEQLERVLQSPSTITGSSGWILYYARFFLSLGLLLKHVVPHPFMSEQERSIPWKQRLDHEWNKRKYALLNDSIWATANLSCFFWLSYRVSLRMGLFGDYITALLLVMDLSLTIFRYSEEQKKHLLLMQAFKSEHKKITAELTRCSNPSKRLMLQEHAALLQQRINNQELDWRYQQLSLYNELFYAAALLVAFCLLIGLWAPGGLIASSAIIITGAVACFGLTVLFNAIENTLPIVKMYSRLQALNKEQQRLQQLFLQVGDDADQQKIIFIKLQDLSAQTQALQKEIYYKIVLGLRAFIIESITPVIVLAAIVFLPVGGAVAALSGFFLLAIASKCCISYFEPKQSQPSHYCDNQFRLFKASQSEIPGDVKEQKSNVMPAPTHPNLASST